MKMTAMAFLTIIFLSPMVSGETEPNDNISQADLINQGTTTGFVEYGNDDLFKFDLPARHEMEILLELFPGEDGSIVMEDVDEDGHSSWLSGIYLMVSSYDEMDDGKLLNKEDTSEMKYLKVSGEGNYSITIDIQEIPDVQDEHSSKETAMIIEEGIFTGSVTSDYVYGDDTDYFLIKLKDDHRLTVTLTMTEADEDDLFSLISCEGEFDGSGLFDLFYLSVYDPGESDSQEWLNGKGRTLDYYLIVEGSGEYTLEVEIEKVSDQGADETKILLGGVLFICGGGLFTIIVILVTVIIVVSILRRKGSKDR